MSLSRLQLVHDPDYIRSLEKPGALEPILGLPVDPETQDRFLSFQRMVCGGTLCAHNALKRQQVAVNLGGGLHHAGRDRGSGFCVFNDVAVAIAFLRDTGPRHPHPGDRSGSARRRRHPGHLRRRPHGHTFSIHNQDLGETEAVASTSIALGTDVDDATYLAAIREHLPPVFEAFQPGPGVLSGRQRPQRRRPAGRLAHLPGGLLERDRFVTDLVRPPGADGPVPMVILLAGGYGPMAWRHAAGFFSWLLQRIQQAGHPPGTGTAGRPLPQAGPPDETSPADAKDPPTNESRPGSPPIRDDDWGLTEQDLGRHRHDARHPFPGSLLPPRHGTGPGGIRPHGRGCASGASRPCGCPSIWTIPWATPCASRPGKATRKSCWK